MGWSYNQKSKVTPLQRQIIAGVLSERNLERGQDSWSMATVAKDGALDIRRGLGDITVAPGYEFGLKDFVMAHTRKATSGAISVANAHAFEIGDICGSHNGCIYEEDELKKKFNRTHEVDSMHLFSHINEGLPLDEVRGYGAIEFIRKSEHRQRVYLANIGRGELAIYQIRFGNGKRSHGVIWSSNYKHIEAALSAAGLGNSYSELKVEEGKVYYVENAKAYVTEKVLKLKENYTTTTYYGNGYHHKKWKNERHDNRIGYWNDYGEGDGTEFYNGHDNWKDKTTEANIVKVSSEEEDMLLKTWNEYLEAKGLLEDDSEAVSDNTIKGWAELAKG